MDHDHPYKELFTQPELVADLLRLAEMADGLDLASLDRRNGSYVSADWRGREDDVIWRVRWGDRDLYVPLCRDQWVTDAQREIPRSSLPAMR